jgi:hypothetical protein
MCTPKAQCWRVGYVITVAGHKKHPENANVNIQPEELGRSCKVVQQSNTFAECVNVISLPFGVVIRWTCMLTSTGIIIYT